MNDALVVAGRRYGSRLLVGTGKYRDFAETRAAVEASGAEIVTVAIRRTNIGQNPGEPSLLEALPPSKYTYLPNTAGCYNAADAVRTLRLARELLDGHDLVKLEVLGDPHTLYPNMPETLKAAQQLVKEGFKVMVYCSDDPVQAQMLEAAGCVAVMPLASPAACRTSAPAPRPARRSERLVPPRSPSRRALPDQEPRHAQRHQCP